MGQAWHNLSAVAGGTQADESGEDAGVTRHIVVTARVFPFVCSVHSRSAPQFPSPLVVPSFPLSLPPNHHQSLSRVQSCPPSRPKTPYPPHYVVLMAAYMKRIGIVPNQIFNRTPNRGHLETPCYSLQMEDRTCRLERVVGGGTER